MSKSDSIGCSYKGVPFYLSASNDSYGSDGELHTFYGRDAGWYEPMGNKDPVFALEVIVTDDISGDYKTARDNLFKACAEKTPGELKHPEYGSLNVYCQNWAVRRDYTEGGICYINLEFLHIPPESTPFASADSLASIHNGADSALQASALNFADNFSLNGVAGFVSDSACTQLSQCIEAVSDMGGLLESEELAGYTKAAFNFAGEVSRIIEDPSAWINYQKNALLASLPEVVKDGLSLARQVLGFIRLQTPQAGSPAGAKDALNKLQGFSLPPATAKIVTPSRQQEETNRQAIVNLVSQGAVIEEARLCQLIPLQTYEQAEQYKTELVAKFDELQQAPNCSDRLFTSLRQLQISASSTLTQRGASMARIGHYSNLKTRPALVLAYEIYGTLEPAEELVGRNNITHPGFVPGGRNLEILLQGKDEA